MSLSDRELHVMQHATGWRSNSPLYRNHFCAGEGHHDWETLQSLCERGLMLMHRPSELSGGDATFVVTDAGIQALRRHDAEQRNSATLPSAAVRAVAHILARMREDANVYYWLGFGTQTFTLLCEAEAEFTGKPIDEVRENRMHCHDTRPTRLEELEARIRELEQGQGAL